jgi:hypothetical protein
VTPATYLAVALIAAITSLIVVSVNVISSRISRREDREEKHNEWLRDKQVKDVEDIMLALSRFMQQLSDCVEDIDVTQSLINRSLYWELETRPWHEDDPGFIATAKRETVKSLRESGDNLHKASAKLNDLAFEREPWFAYTAKRLTIWLEQKEGKRENLAQIGDEFKTFYLGVRREASGYGSFLVELSRRKGELAEIDVLQSESYSKGIKDSLVGKSQLESNTLILQETLADRFKPRELQISPAPSKDKLLVYLARQVERGVSWFFR